MSHKIAKDLITVAKEIASTNIWGLPDVVEDALYDAGFGDDIEKVKKRGKNKWLVITEWSAEEMAYDRDVLRALKGTGYKLDYEGYYELVVTKVR